MYFVKAVMGGATRIMISSMPRLGKPLLLLRVFCGKDNFANAHDLTTKLYFYSVRAQISIGSILVYAGCRRSQDKLSIITICNCKSALLET
jgi:hypothetical protein